MMNPSHCLSFLPAGSLGTAIRKSLLEGRLAFVVSPVKVPQTFPEPLWQPLLVLRNLQWLPTPLLVFQMPHLCPRLSLLIHGYAHSLLSRTLEQHVLLHQDTPGKSLTSLDLICILRMMPAHQLSQGLQQSLCVSLQVTETLTNRDLNHKESCLLRNLVVGSYQAGCATSSC